VNDPQVIAVGLCTPVGAATAPSLAAIQADIRRFAETEVEDVHGHPVQACRLTLLAPALSRSGRMIALATRAAAELVAQLGDARRVPLFLGLPEPGRGAPVDARAVTAGLREQVGEHLVVARSWASGRAGFFEALAAAAAELRGGRVGPIVVVGGVDSTCDPASLADLAAARLHLGADNRDGRIFGEAAGFVALAAAGSFRGQALGRVVAAAQGVERASFASGRASTAEGLTAAFHALRLPHRVDAVIACQPGERYWSTEFAYASLRSAEGMPEPMRWANSGRWLGDAGAGAGPVMLGLALVRGRRHGPSRTLLYGTADDGRLAACVVERT
jgi:3-oxoacyl-[acyl-carrier-protein] synthase-1